MTNVSSTGPVWRVLTWNVRGNERPDIGSLAEVIAAYTPDVVTIQELRHGQARALATRLGWRHVWARKHFPYSPLVWWQAEGHAILTPHRLTATVSRTISPGVSTWSYRHRIVLAGNVLRPDDELRVYDTHLAAHDHPDERIAQARRVAAFVNVDGATRRVVAGDLNADGEIEVIRELRAAGLHDPGGPPTHPSTVPQRRFDYILIPQGATVIDRHQPDGGDEWWELSDHLPVMLAWSDQATRSIHADTPTS